VRNMSDLQKQLDALLSEAPRCIHLAGVDGTGKTTQGKTLLALLSSRGMEVQYAWLRFPRFFTIPFLAYARLRGFSHREVVDGNEHGYWNFDRSWLMSRVFPWVLWFDAFLLALIKVTIPLWTGKKILCDRFVVDTMVDLMVGLKDPHFDEHMPGRLFLSLLPQGTRVVVLDLETEIAQQRSPELVGDRTHAQRRQTYLDVASRQGFPVISAAPSIKQITSQLLDVLASYNERISSQERLRSAELSTDNGTTHRAPVHYPHATGDDR